MRKLLIPGLVGCSLAFGVRVAYLWDDNVISVPQSYPAQISQFVQKQGKSITVKVRSESVLGSGFIIATNQGVYTVVTNDHVVRSAAPPYQIETPDGKVYDAEMLPIDFAGNDLAVLRFDSQGREYTVATIGSSPVPGEQVFAAGFPFNAQSEFVFEEGEVGPILEKALEGGYQIGYTNNIQKGMSGGPLLNVHGEVVSVNGMHAYPLWGDPYIYMDGNEPSASLKEELVHYSFGIPIETVTSYQLPVTSYHDS